MSVDRVKSVWEELGRVDPLWAVLTDPTRRNRSWDVEEFLATGASPVRQAVARLERAGLSLGDRVLDFGCGAGRLCDALASHAAEVVGVDIAESMVEEARRINRHPDRVSFVHYDGRVLPFADASFDSVVSLISIQHSPPEVQLACLVELLRVVRPGGALVLQIPSRPARPAPLEPEAMRARIRIVTAPPELGVGQFARLTAEVTNSGARPWPVDRLIRLGNHWLAGTEAARWNDGRTDLPCEVAPGQSVEMGLTICAPDEPGKYTLTFDLVQETVAWWAEHGSEGASLPITVTAAHAELDASVDPATSAPLAVAARPAAVGRDDAGMEMYGMDPTLLRLLFAHAGSHVVGVAPDTMAGPEWESFTYVVERGTVA